MSESGGSRRPDARRVLDLTLGWLGLAASLPILAAAAAGMHLTGDHGPFLFRALRVGAGGSAITVLKIRTMREGPSGIGLTSAGDPRITSFGRVIRRYRIDELPQLLNVVRGDMSLVGPRPEDARYVDLADPLHRRVYSEKPGITGPAQIRFRHEGDLLAASPDPERLYREVILPAKLRLDAEYLDRRTVRSDLGVIARTLRVLLPRPFGVDDEEPPVA